MNIKLFINGKYTLVGAILFYLTGVYLTGRFVPAISLDTHPGLFFPGVGTWLSPTWFNYLLNSTLLLIVSILVLRLNNLFSVIPKRTLLPLIFFLLFELASPKLSLLGSGNLLVAVLLALLFLFFGAYQHNRAHPSFLMLGIIATVSLFVPTFIWYAPLFILGYTQIRYLHLKSLLGGLLGLVTPFWILLGTGILPYDKLTELLPHFTLQLPGAEYYTQPQFWTIVLTLVLGLYSGTANTYTIFNEKRQIRAYNGFINLLSVFTAILFMLDLSNVELYLPLLNFTVAMQAAFFFTHNNKKAGMILFYVILILYTALFVWSLSPV